MNIRRAGLAASLLLCSVASLAACQSPEQTAAQVAAAGPPVAGPAVPPTDPMVGGAAMYPTKDIVDNAVNSKDHTTLVAAVKAAGLVDTLKGPGPFTVFAPTNEAFDLLPKGTVATLLKPANKPKLVKVLTYHVVPGRIGSADLARQIAAGGGKAVITTVEGEKLIATMDNGGIMLTDAQGGNAMVTTPDVYQSNGVIHVIDHVLLP
jgi:uncharacterized surface protein with fasciclin (FAS1) repeats